jgi:hypothetical protein
MTQISLPKPEEIWMRFVDTVMDVFVEALRNLRSDEGRHELELEIAHGKNANREVHLNNVLHKYALKANLERRKARRGVSFGFSIIPQCVNDPDLDKEGPSPSDNVLPDFGCLVLDESVMGDQPNGRRFTIECKRLGQPTSASWVYNRQYVTDGIMRFLELTHCYGKDEVVGAMIGYIETMEFEGILREVNAAIVKAATANVTLRALEVSSEGWKEDDVSHLSHPEPIARPFEISPFVLRHLWVDMRDKE